MTADLILAGWEEAEILWHGTGEPEAYAKQFAKVFEAAGIAVKIHTLGPFIPSAWGLMIVISENDASSKLKEILDKANIQNDLVESNGTIGKKFIRLYLLGRKRTELRY